MTKDRLRQLIELMVDPRYGLSWEERQERDALQAEFEAWEPELADISRADANHYEQEAVNARQQRDELRQVGAWVVREWLCPLGNDSDLGQAIEALQGLLKEPKSE